MPTTTAPRRRATRRHLALTLALLAGLATMVVPPAAAEPDATAGPSPAVAPATTDEIRSGAALTPWDRTTARDGVAATPTEPSRLTTSRSIPISAVRKLVVDEAHGHVYISGDDRIVVTDLEGNIQQQLDVPSPWDMVVVGNILYVAQGSAGVIGRAQIGATLAMLSPIAASMPLGLENVRSLAYAQGSLWTTSGRCAAWAADLVRVDLATETATTFDETNDFYCPIVDAAGDTLVLGETGLSPITLRSYDISSGAPVERARVDHGVASNLQDIEIDLASGLALTASGAPYEGQSWNLATMTAATTYVTGPYPTAIAFTTENGGFVAVGKYAPYGNSLALFRRGFGSVPQWSVRLETQVLAGGLAFSGDGRRLYAVSTTDATGTNPATLHVIDVDDPGTTTTQPPTTTAPPTTTTPPSSNFGEFHAVDPARVHDSRSGARVQRAAVTVTGRGGVPMSGVSAVAVNVTVTDAAAAGFLTVYPANVAQPNASTANYRPARTVPNMAVIGVSGGGQLALYASSPAHVIVDVVGWFGDSSAPNGSRFHPVLPQRWFDTRSDARGDGRVRPVGPGDSVITSFTGGRAVAEAHVGAMALNVTATNTTSESYLSVTPLGAPLVSSNLNWLAGDVVPNSVITKIDAAAGVARFTNAFGATDVIADVFGFWDDGTPGFGARFVPTPPVRLVDTRMGLTPPRSIDATAVRLAPFTAVTFDALSYSHPLASAVALNITAVDPSQPGYLTVFPLTDDQANGLETSTLNFGPGDVRANLSLMPLGASGQVVLANMSEGTVDVLVDLTGFFL